MVQFLVKHCKLQNQSQNFCGQVITKLQCQENNSAANKDSIDT